MLWFKGKHCVNEKRDTLVIFELEFDFDYCASESDMSDNELACKTMGIFLKKKKKNLALRLPSLLYRIPSCISCFDISYLTILKANSLNF